MSGERVCYRISVVGKVQGVFYRASAKNMALDLEITGWVKNQPDGSVMIEAEGLEKDVDAFLAWCKTGPTYSRVTGVDKTNLPPQNYEQFEIRY